MKRELGRTIRPPTIPPRADAQGSKVAHPEVITCTFHATQSDLPFIYTLVHGWVRAPQIHGPGCPGGAGGPKGHGKGGVDMGPGGDVQEGQAGWPSGGKEGMHACCHADHRSVVRIQAVYR